VSISFHVEGIDQLEAAFEDWKERVDVASESIVRKGGAIIADAAKRQFVGGGKSAPVTKGKPTVRSGNLRNSIQTQNIRRISLGTWSSQTGPTIIYGRRIELGYHGTDSLGRNYSNPGQPPYPFLSPGVKEAEPALRDLVVAEMLDAQEA
jgi:HK97 gp10 family phage protein